MRSITCFLLLFRVFLPASAAELARWEASAPERDQGLSLIREKDADWRIEKQAGVSLASIIPLNDYYRRAAFVMRVDRPPAGPVWLTVEYLDRGYGLISISSDAGGASGRLSIPAVNQWGIARLNTGKLRRALFRLEPPAFERPLRIQGLEYLGRLTLSDSAPPREPLPEVPPAVRLQRPMELVMGSLEANVQREDLPATLANLRNQLPLVRALGFNGVESYVRWNAVEGSRGVFDWSYYDAIVAEAVKHGMQWLPLVVSGPAYTLPDWFHDSPDHLGFECLEHRQRTEIQTIFSDRWPIYVERFLLEFGKHYGAGKGILGMRTGVSGTYGEVQYPTNAGANMQYRGQPLHSHDGYWAAGSEAVASFRAWLRSRYPSIAEINRAWQADYRSFEDVQTFLPGTARTARQRLDFCNWYLDSMSDWADRWGAWVKEALPGHPAYQSVGGWDAVHNGTDSVRITRDAARRGLGVRVTNEGDNFAQNFGMTRLISSATRFYGARFALEPAGRATGRGVVARLFGALVSGADQLFYYAPNLFANDQGVAKWLQYAPLLDRRAKPLIDVAVFFPNTANKLDEAGIEKLNGEFYTRVYSLRAITDHDFASEQMILDGALDRYKVLVFLWGATTEKPVLDRIAQWVEGGGTVITALTPRTVEGDTSVAQRWEQGETGKGRVIRYSGDSLPAEYYLRFVGRQLQQLNNLHRSVTQALRMEKPDTVYWSVLQSGQLALLNFDDLPATVRFAGRTLRMEPYGILLEPLIRESSANK